LQLTILFNGHFARRETVQELLQKGGRCNKPQNWHLHVKDKKKGITPKCRACRAEQQPGDLTASVTGLNVPYGQTFVTETTFYFCPKAVCVDNIPVWTNLKPPKEIKVDTTIDGLILTNLKQEGLPITGR